MNLRTRLLAEAGKVIEWVERPDLRSGKVTKRRVQTPGPPGANVASGKLIEAVNLDMTKSIEPLRKQMNEIVVPAAMKIASSASLWPCPPRNRRHPECQSPG
jgi:hypothetical protein